MRGPGICFTHDLFIPSLRTISQLHTPGEEVGVLGSYSSLVNLTIWVGCLWNAYIMDGWIIQLMYLNIFIFRRVKRQM